MLAVVFLAVSLGLCMKTLGEEKTATLRKLVQELNDVVIVFLNFVVSKFGPVAIFMLLTRTFASYGVEHLKPAVAYVILTVALLLIFLIIGYPAFIAIFAHLDPFKFAKKIARVAVFGFSTSSSAATLPLNVKTTVEELGVDEKIASLRPAARHDHQHERNGHHAGHRDALHRRLRGLASASPSSSSSRCSRSSPPPVRPRPPAPARSSSSPSSPASAT